MAAAAGRDAALDTVKNDIVALQHEFDVVRQRSVGLVQDRVNAHPLQSVLVAFAAGLKVSSVAFAAPFCAAFSAAVLRIS